MVDVIKATGQIEPFSEEKLRYSIHRAGIPDEIQDQVVAHVNSKLYNNIPTSEVYHHITEFLVKSNKPHVKAKYSLKQAIMDLGPTGYPFEDFVAEILKTQGYSVAVRQVLPGKCVSHEIDVVAEKNGEKMMVEAKFHNGPGTRTDIHVALYTKARFDDIKERHNFSEVYLITNTKATIDALNYGDCSNVKVISWAVPEGESLRDMVEHSKVFPITTLTTLSQAQKQILLENHVVLCTTIVENPGTLSILGLPKIKEQETINEAKFVTNHS